LRAGREVTRCGEVSPHDGLFLLRRQHGARYFLLSS
jgi:hypothetical protein